MISYEYLEHLIKLSQVMINIPKLLKIHLLLKFEVALSHGVGTGIEPEYEYEYL